MSDHETLVSIIVPIYNGAGFIRQTVQMVCAQTYKNWELIIVDDASADETRRVVKDIITSKDENSDKIHLVVKNRNGGAAKARNTGIQVARGRYIAFLDADDIWLPKKLSDEIIFMNEKKAAFAFTSYEFGDENAKPTGRIVHAPKTLDFKHALSRTVIFTSTVMFDTNLISKDRIMMPEIESEDTATWWKILKSGVNAYGLDKVLTVYRRPSGSLSSNKFVAIKRIWKLYMNVAGITPVYAFFCLIGWAFRATLRRI